MLLNWWHLITTPFSSGLASSYLPTHSCLVFLQHRFRYVSHCLSLLMAPMAGRKKLNCLAQHVRPSLFGCDSSLYPYQLPWIFFFFSSPLLLCTHPELEAPWFTYRFLSSHNNSCSSWEASEIPATCSTLHFHPLSLILPPPVSGHYCLHFMNEVAEVKSDMTNSQG